LFVAPREQEEAERKARDEAERQRKEAEEQARQMILDAGFVPEGAPVPAPAA